MSRAESPAAQAEPALLECRALVVGHQGHGLLPALDLTIRPGELWAVIGRNGSGKTTWLRTLLGLLPPVSGRVHFAAARPRLTYLAQRQTFDDHYPLRVRDVVAMGTDRDRSCFLSRSRQTSQVVQRELARVGAAELAARPFRELSEGQKQRVLFARVAASEPDLAVLDEPTSAMDLVAEQEAWQLLERLRRETRLALIVVSHYVGLAGRYADQLVFLDRDTPAAIVGKPRDVFEHAVFRERYGETPEPKSPPSSASPSPSGTRP
jgi:zinc transport system ATP-binding protein